MRKTENFELNLLDAEDFVNREDLNENAEKIDEVMKSLDTPEYDVSEQTNIEKLSSGESLKVALRKLAKAVADYISHKADKVAHITAEERTVWNAKLGTEKIAANLTTDTEGMVLAASMGKNLQEQISTLNSNTRNCPVNKFMVVQSVDSTPNETSTVTLEEGVYLITQAHPYGPDSLYLLKCKIDHPNSIVAIVNDPNAQLTVDTSCELTITITRGDGAVNFRWWHIIKIAGLNSLNVR